MSDTKKRQEAILKLVKKERIKTQGALRQLLLKKNVIATQATISRDIQSLGLSKVFGYYAIPGEGKPVIDVVSRLKGKINKVVGAGSNLIVIHTNVGDASSVALAIDEAYWKSVSGTIAGDDTIFVACAAMRDTEDTLKRLKLIAPEAFIR